MKPDSTTRDPETESGVLRAMVLLKTGQRMTTSGRNTPGTILVLVALAG